jgi:hypothetical protein
MYYLLSVTFRETYGKGTMTTDRSEYIYECPNGCTSQGGKPIAKSVQGWKHHMSRQHKGWSEEQLAAALIKSSGRGTDANKSLFLAEGSGAGAPGQGKEADKKPLGEGDGQDRPNVPASEPPKIVQFKSKKFRKFISALPETLFKKKGIELDADDKEILDTGSELLEEMFGVAFEIPDAQWVIRSRWVALLFPIGAIFLVYLKHTFSFDIFKKKDETESSLAAGVQKANESVN